MPRIARLKVKEGPAIYHLISRTVLDGFVLGDVEKDFLLDLIKRLSKIYFAEVLGFAIMGNHFHLLVRMHTGDKANEKEIKKRLKIYYGKDTRSEVDDKEQLMELKKKWVNLSEYMREVKQVFARFYNKRHGRRGFFWSERFKSLIVDEGETLVNCLAYIDLNPVRAGLVKKPEQYKWCSLGYHVKLKNKGNFLSLNFGLKKPGVKNKQDRLKYYREFVAEKGGIGGKKKTGKQGLELKEVDRFRNRTRYFSDSGVIGSKEFVSSMNNQFKGHFTSKHEKRPKAVKGLEGVFSLKRLSEKI